MTPIFINRCRSARLPRQFLSKWIKKLSRRSPFIKIKKELVIVFVDPAEMKAINKRFRGKNYATDVLSFEGEELGVFGELVLCPQVLKSQSKDTGLTFQHELGYMVVHGCLHLLGYDHEKSKAEEKRMFRLQDQLFASIVKGV